MLRAEIIDKRQYAEQEHHGHGRINAEPSRSAAQTGPDLIRFDRERSHNKHTTHDYGDGLVGTPDGPDGIGNHGSGNDGEAK